MRVVITGGGGFIGSNLVDHFLENRPEWQVAVLDDFSLGQEENVRDSRVEVTKGSVLDSSLLLSVFRGTDIVIHLAGIGSVPRSVENPLPTHDVNATGTLSVLEAARALDVGFTIVASSSSVYGSNPNLPRRESDWTRPLSPYAVSKLATEAYANAYAASYGMQTLAFRFFNVYGPRQRADHPYAAVIPRFLHAALNGQAIQINGNGDQKRDFTYVGSVCAAIHQACELRLQHLHPVNLAFGTQTSIRQLVASIEQALGYEVPVIFAPERPGDIRESQADPETLQRLLPDLQPVPLSSGLRRTLDWFESN